MRTGTILRILRHLILPDWWALRPFSKATLRKIEQAISASENTHLGELRFVVEATLPLHGLWHGQSARARAVELFSQLGVWDTEHNTGVLIYVQLIDRRVEIVADRGINAKVGDAFWSTVCRRIEGAFREGQFEEGTLLALSAITDVLAEHFPATGDNPDELPNAPLIA
ncbi:TPM domain-containing protein [Propionivibrio sp.]|uniref:TPM domain-containing protein n=1 Tax=Propionivibrio sp. TaxID=2212460 RepID=UPI0025EE4B2A|nr:TPM domain-containing protein [Propionivibrio sp.]MBK7356073.1 TPM domain-containing protein [Propionivibrio sp.]MBK8400259.1 TPM domain-containing protein [Propionivibrio sp.]MBK8744034.1 TPM domain-containing protein [Propionivibrio sp.]MBK8893038.1 TPM domain-containing protein [Propionivibrio sp.]MBL0207280.1 TPM domain-containing protein [Propionivibrio sp.]